MTATGERYGEEVNRVWKRTSDGQEEWLCMACHPEMG